MTVLRCSVCERLLTEKTSSRFRGTCGDKACLRRANERRRIAATKRRRGRL